MIAEYARSRTSFSEHCSDWEEEDASTKPAYGVVVHPEEDEKSPEARSAVQLPLLEFLQSGIPVAGASFSVHTMMVPPAAFEWVLGIGTASNTVLVAAPATALFSAWCFRRMSRQAVASAVRNL